MSSEPRRRAIPSRALAHLRANAVAYLALFIALGTGSAYAARQLAPNSVGTAQLKRGAVTAAKVKKGSLLARDFKRGQLRAGARGEVGPPGPAGPTGPPGPRGAAGLAGSARAYAEVTREGNLVPGKTRGFTAVAEPKPGTYCLVPAAGIDPATSVAIVSPLFFSPVAGTIETALRSEEQGPCSSETFEIVAFTNYDAPTELPFAIAVP